MNELTNEQIEANKQEFIELFNTNITRDGAESLLKWLNSSDFFEAPASTKNHMCCKGGLCAHSLFVYKRLKANMERETNLTASDETIAICGLLHDLCKIDYYKTRLRNVKENGEWIQRSEYFPEETLPYGHGEKSVYIISGFMKLSREEAIAINWHMGWSDVRFVGGSFSLGQAYKKFPFATMVFIADVEATFIDENSALNT